MIDINLKGMVPAAVLPMTVDYQPDYGAYARYLEWLIAENAVSLAINMDTGEGPQLTVEEQRRAAEVAVEVATGTCTVVAGVAMKPRVQGFADVIYADPVLDYRARCKVALAHIGVLTRDQTYVRPPLLQITPEESEHIGRALAEAGMSQLSMV